MFEALTTFFKKVFKPGQADEDSSKNTAKERLHLVLMQDRANVSADFLDLMKQEIIDVIKKYIEVDEKEIDVRLTNQSNDDGTNGAPALYANIPILNIRNDVKGEKMREQEESSEKKTAPKEKKKKEKDSSKKESSSEEVKEETEAVVVVDSEDSEEKIEKVEKENEENQSEQSDEICESEKQA